MELLAKQLATAMPMLRAPRVWLSMLNEALMLFDIDSPPRVAAFLARIARETNQCRNLEEDLSFPAAALRRTWPKRFPTTVMAQAYEWRPEKLANYLYANRLGNGPPESRDGYRFRGRGLIRITGRANYAAAGEVLGVDLERLPQSLLEPRNAAVAAAWCWTTHSLDVADDEVEPRVSPISLFGTTVGVSFTAGEQ